MLLEIPSRKELNARITAACISLELCSHVAASQGGSGSGHAKPGSRAPKGTNYPDFEEMAVRYRDARSDLDRLNVVVDAEMRLKELRGLRDPVVEGGTDGWRAYIRVLHGQGVSAAEIARREGCSRQYVGKVLRMVKAA